MNEEWVGQLKISQKARLRVCGRQRAHALVGGKWDYCADQCD